MKTFHYIDNEPSPSRLQDLKIKLDNSVAEVRHCNYKAWLHYANLERWRRQGHHFYYLSYGTTKANRMICTCGLSVGFEDDHRLTRISALVAEKVSHLELDPLQSLEGHRDFLTKEPVSALIVRYEGQVPTLWTAYCQICGETSGHVSNRKAKSFAKSHDLAH